jgi:hypothetical protein
MSIRRIVLSVLAVMIVFSVPAIAFAATISGSVTFSGDTPRSGDILVLSLRNSSNLRSHEQTISVGGQSPPYNFTIDTSNLANGTYRVVAELGDANRTRRYRGDTTITYNGGDISAGTILMSESPGRIGDTSSGTLRLLIGVVLAALAGLLLLWRRLRIRRRQRWALG